MHASPSLELRELKVGVTQRKETPPDIQFGASGHG